MTKLISAEEQINGFWETLPYCYDIENREFFEKRAADSWSPANPLLVALHYMWKRDVKERREDLHNIIEDKLMKQIRELEKENALLKQKLSVVKNSN